MSSVRGKKQHLILTEKKCLSAQRGGGKVKSSMRKLFYSVCCVLAHPMHISLFVASVRKKNDFMHSFSNINWCYRFCYSGEYLRWFGITFIHSIQWQKRYSMIAHTNTVRHKTNDDSPFPIPPNYSFSENWTAYDWLPRVSIDLLRFTYLCMCWFWELCQ